MISSPCLSISCDEIRAVYVQGEESVMALVESRVTRTNALEDRVDALENQLKKDSHNSSKPTSSDGFKKKTKSDYNKKVTVPAAANRIIRVAI